MHILKVLRSVSKYVSKVSNAQSLNETKTSYVVA